MQNTIKQLPPSVTNTQLASIIKSLNDGALRLPEIQRDWVWKNQKIVDLFDSLYRGFPVGAVLVWLSSLDVETKKWPTGAFKLHADSPIHGYLLDGQQRFTAMRKVLSGDFNLKFDLEHEVFEKETKRNNLSPTHVDVADVLLGRAELMKVIDRLREEESPEYKFDDLVMNYQRLQNILATPVPVLQFHGHDYAAATELFIRFNSGGVRLKPADLALAKLAMRAPKIVTQEIQKFNAKWSRKGYEYTIPFLVRCMVAVRTHQVRFRKPSELWDANPRELRSDWRRTRKALESMLKFISGTMNWDSSQWIPSYSALIPLVCLFAWRAGRGPAKLNTQQAKLARRWLALACIRNVFSGSAETALDKVLSKLWKSHTVKTLWNTLIKRNQKPVTRDEIEEARRSGALMSVYYSMIRQSDARDWFTGDKLEGSVVGHNANIEVHHIFPRAVLQARKVSPAKINHFANYALVEKDSNIEILDSEPSEYLVKVSRARKKLPAQCIPDDRSKWRVSAYDRFLKARTGELANAMNKYLGIRRSR